MFIGMLERLIGIVIGWSETTGQVGVIIVNKLRKKFFHFKTYVTYFRSICLLFFFSDLLGCFLLLGLCPKSFFLKIP
jgi:hypothetical protein